uniref:60S ribosomal protein L41 n=1 Tax=Culicoides sonorensis TaxID=179676 RepID=A0A336LWU6_CULSO
MRAKWRKKRMRRLKRKRRKMRARSKSGSVVTSLVNCLFSFSNGEHSNFQCEFQTPAFIHERKTDKIVKACAIRKYFENHEPMFIFNKCFQRLKVQQINVTPAAVGTKDLDNNHASSCFRKKKPIEQKFP